MKFKLYLKKNGSHKIFLSVTHNSSRHRSFTGYTLSSTKHWDHKKQQVNKNEPGYKSINSGLNGILRKCELIKNQMITDSIHTGQAVSLAGFIRRYKGISDEGFWDRWKQFQSERVNNRSFRTIKLYNTLVKHLREFEKKDGEITFQKINLSFYTRFMNHLQKTMIQNSAHNYVSKLKAFLNYCYQSGWINSDKGWLGWKATTKRAPKEGIFYTLEQLQLLENMDLSRDMHRNCVFQAQELEQIRKIYLFQCFTGLRHSDLHQLQGLTPSFTNTLQIQNVKGGKRRKVFLVKKSRQLFDEIQGFGGFTITLNRYNFGVCVLAKQFGWSGEVYHQGKMVEKWQAFTSHSARYTFVSILSGHASGMIVKGLADHSDLKTTEGYFLENEKEMEAAMKRAFG